MANYSLTTRPIDLPIRCYNWWSGTSPMQWWWQKREKWPIYIWETITGTKITIKIMRGPPCPIAHFFLCYLRTPITWEAQPNLHPLLYILKAVLQCSGRRKRCVCNTRRKNTLLAWSLLFSSCFWEQHIIRAGLGWLYKANVARVSYEYYYTQLTRVERFN